MKAIYNQATDELIFKRKPLKGKPVKQKHFKFWIDEGGLLYAFSIRNFSKIVSMFEKDRWKGITISEADIKRARKELLKKLEEKF